MVEGEARTVQHQAIGQAGIAIEPITQDGMSQAIWMSCMHAQLMCSTGQGSELHPRMVGLTGDDLPVGDAQFAVHGVENLPRPIVYIHTEGEFDMPGVFGDVSFQQGDIGLANMSLLELPG